MMSPSIATTLLSMGDTVYVSLYDSELGDYLINEVVPVEEAIKGVPLWLQGNPHVEVYPDQVLISTLTSTLSITPFEEEVMEVI